MEELNKEIENQIEEAKHQLRLEIAEKCLIEEVSINFVIKVCAITKAEVVAVARALKRKNYLLEKEIREQKKQGVRKKAKQQKIQEKYETIQEKKQKEKEGGLYYKEQRQREADIQREIAAEKTRLLLQSIKEQQRNEVEQKQKAEELDILRKKEIQRQIIKKQQVAKISRQESLEETNTLSKEQKMIASVGKCYLRGLNIKQAILFSKASKEDVERIYNSFKNK